MADQEESAAGDDGGLRPYIPRLVIVGVAAVVMCGIVYLTRNLLGPLFDKAYEPLAVWTGHISAAGIIAGGSASIGALLLWREWSFVRCLEDNAYFKRIFNLSRAAFLFGVAETLAVTAIGAFLVLNAALWIGVDNPGDQYFETPKGEFYSIAMLICFAYFGLGKIESPGERFYWTLTGTLVVALWVLWTWTHITPAETDHGYLMWAVFFGIAGWRLYRAWQNDPEARIHHALVARTGAYLVTGYVVLVLLVHWFRHGWLSALLSIGDFVYVIVIAWLWVKLSVDPSAAKRTFFGLPFVRHKQNRAFAWLQRVNPFRGAPLRSAPAGDGEAASADGRPFRDG